MSKEIRDDAQLIELVRQINFLLTGRYVSVNTTPIQKAIDCYAAEREREAYKKGCIDAGIKNILADEAARKSVEAALKETTE